MEPRPIRAIGLNALLFAVILGGAAALGFIPYRFEVQAARREVQRTILAVGRLKADEIARWLADRRAEILAVSGGPQMALDVERWGALDPERRRWVTGRLARLRSLGGYAEVAIIGKEGDLVVADGGTDAPMRALDREDVRRAVATDAVVQSRLAQTGGGQGAAVALDLIAPLAAIDARGRRVVGAIVYRIDPRAFLFPLVQSWPTDSASAETLLVARDGASVRFLNDLRHRKGTALVMTASAEDPQLLAAKAVRGEQGLVEGVDYRGVPVLGWIEPVEGTPWILVSKIDQAEVYAPVRDYLWIYLAFVLLSGITAGIATRMRHRSLREASLRREHEATVRYVEALRGAEAERERLIASLRKALDEVKTLRGILPICASCKRVRDDAGYWSQVEAFVSRHTQARFSHGVCPDCMARLYPGLTEAPEPQEPTD